MLLKYLLVVLCYLSPAAVVDSARILGIFPMPSISHQIVFRALMMELASRGHELVIITPNPALPKDRSPDNITEIDTSAAYKIITEMYDEVKVQLKRGIVTGEDQVINDDTINAMIALSSYQFEMEQVKELLNDKSQKFDLVFVEAVVNYPLVVSHIFNAPAILFSSLFGFPEHLEVMGAVTWHPLYYPSVYRQSFKYRTVWDKIRQMHFEWKLFWMTKATETRENELLKNRFGENVPTIEELHRNVQMLFLNAHPLFGNNRPVPPSVQYLGALHLQPVKQLPQDLKEYLDSSVRGVVYVSLGTNVRPSMMDQDLLDAFLNAFKVLPFDILWKFDGDDLVNLPANVKIQKWFPQRDLLVHNKIKVFITQGGLQSTDEAIDAGVPLVGIPMLGDQWYNVNKYEELGIGEQLDALTMTADDLINAVNKVVTDDSYRNNISRLREVMNDQPQRPLERGVWWTEHVLRHGGAHLRARAALVSWRDYLLADVLAALGAALAAALLAAATILYTCRLFIHKYIRTPVMVKSKQS